MPARNIARQATVPGVATSKAVPVYVDSDDNIMKMIPAGSGTTEVQIVDASSTQTLTNKTLTSPTIATPTLTNPSIAGSTPVAFTSGTTLALTQATHANRIVYVTDVAAAYALPAATGTGDKYTIALGATQTGASTIKVNATPGTDIMQGTAILFADGGDTVVGFNTAADSDTVDLLGTSNGVGGLFGALYEFWDVASGKWFVRIVSDAANTEVTPFSATVP